MQGSGAMRLTTLDGLRGLFLIFMITTHFAILFPAELQYLKFHYFGYVEDAQGFIFLSGVTVAIAYGRRLSRYGFGPMFRAVLGRIGKIYLYQAVLIVAITLLAVTFWDGETRRGMFAAFAEHPFAYPATSAALLTAAPFINILPLYIVLMAFTPFALRALARGHTAPVIAASALMWVIAQTGLTDVFHAGIGSGLARLGIELPPGTNFNVFAWQVLYVAGLIIGFRLSEGKLDLGHFTGRGCARLLPLMIAAAVLFAALDMAENLGLVESLSGALAGDHRRYHLPAIYVASFVVEAYLLAWLLLAGTDSRYAATRFLSRALNRVLRTPFLTLVGRHSIWVYAYHVLFLYCWVLFADMSEPNLLERNAIFLLVGASAYPVARLDAWLKARQPQAVSGPPVSRDSKIHEGNPT